MQQTKKSNVQTTCNANMATIFFAEKQNKNQNLQKGKQAKRAALADEKKNEKRRLPSKSKRSMHFEVIAHRIVLCCFSLLTIQSLANEHTRRSCST